MDIQEIKGIFEAIIAKLEQLETDRAVLENLLSQIEQLPRSNATLHWRKDRNGEPTLLELLHPSGSEYEQTARRREYIGNNPDRINEAQERVKRYEDWRNIQLSLERLREKQHILYLQIKRLQLDALGRQQALWGQEEDGRLDAPSPQNEPNSLSPRPQSPQDVVEYFRRSPDLSYMAHDLERSFKHYGIV